MGQRRARVDAVDFDSFSSVCDLPSDSRGEPALDCSTFEWGAGRAHRPRIGAFADTKDMERIHNALLQQNVEALKDMDAHTVWLALHEPSDLAMVLTDELGRIRCVNEAWQNLCGYDSEYAEGKTSRIIQGEETDRSEAFEFEEVLRSGHRHFVSMEVVNYTKRGRRFLNRVQATVLQRAEPKDLGCEGDFLFLASLMEVTA